MSCWGFPAGDKYGDYKTPWTAVPIVGLNKVRAIKAGDSVTYAVLANGEIRRWVGTGRFPAGGVLDPGPVTVVHSWIEMAFLISSVWKPSIMGLSMPGRVTTS